MFISYIYHVNNVPTPYVRGKILAVRKRAGNPNLLNRDERLPPGQRISSQMVAMPPITNKYPVISKSDWSMRVYGEVQNEITYSFLDLEKLGIEDFLIDFHCVTRWSKIDQHISGVDFSKIIRQVVPLNSAKYIIFESYDDYSTNLILKEVEENICVIVTKMDGKDVETKYGGPVRAIIPHLYGWKSAKFLHGVRFSPVDEPGFWERYGYNNHGDPWREERFS